MIKSELEYVMVCGRDNPAINVRICGGDDPKSKVNIYISESTVNSDDCDILDASESLYMQVVKLKNDKCVSRLRKNLVIVKASPSVKWRDLSNGVMANVTPAIINKDGIKVPGDVLVPQMPLIYRDGDSDYYLRDLFPYPTYISAIVSLIRSDLIDVLSQFLALQMSKDESTNAMIKDLVSKDHMSAFLMRHVVTNIEWYELAFEGAKRIHQSLRDGRGTTNVCFTDGRKSAINVSLRSTSIVTGKTWDVSEAPPKTSPSAIVLVGEKDIMRYAEDISVRGSTATKREFLIEAIKPIDPVIHNEVTNMKDVLVYINTIADKLEKCDKPPTLGEKNNTSAIVGPTSRYILRPLEGDECVDLTTVLPAYIKKACMHTLNGTSRNNINKVMVRALFDLVKVCDENKARIETAFSLFTTFEDLKEFIYTQHAARRGSYDGGEVAPFKRHERRTFTNSGGRDGRRLGKSGSRNESCHTRGGRRGIFYTIEFEGETWEYTRSDIHVDNDGRYVNINGSQVYLDQDCKRNIETAADVGNEDVTTSLKDALEGLSIENLTLKQLKIAKTLCSKFVDAIDGQVEKVLK